MACSMTCSGVMRNFFSICKALVAIKVWILFELAPSRAFAACVISYSFERANEQIVASLTAAATALMASKSPGELAANPASMTSTCNRSSCLAIRTFSSLLMEAPGDCSPSLKVVSKMISLSIAIFFLLILLNLLTHIKQNPSNLAGVSKIRYVCLFK